MPDYFEEIETIRKSGRWWERPWWRDPLYRAEVGVDADLIEPAFEALREVFDEKWAKRQVNGHPMLQDLFGATGLNPFAFLYELGVSLKTVRQAGKLGSLAKRLKHSEEFTGAHAEVGAVAQWIQAGVKVELDVPSGNGNKNCDWKISAEGAVIYGEVKRIELAQVNKQRQRHDLPPWEREPVPFDLAAEGDKTMDVVEKHASQLPSTGPGVFMVFGRGSAAAMPFSDAAGKRIVERFRVENSPCGHIAGILVVRIFQIPEHGIVQFVAFVRNPKGPELSMDLLKRRFPNLLIWESDKKS